MGVEQDTFHDRTAGRVRRSCGRWPCAQMAPSASSASVRSIDSISNSRWYCFTSAFLGWVRNELEGRLVEGPSSRGHHGQSRPTNSGIRGHISTGPPGSTSRKISPVPRSSGGNYLGAEADRGSSRPRAEMIFSSPLKAPSAYETGYWWLCRTCRNFLLWVLAPALRRHRRDRAFHDLEQGLLHAPLPETSRGD